METPVCVVFLLIVKSSRLPQDLYFATMRRQHNFKPSTQGQGPEACRWTHTSGGRAPLCSSSMLTYIIHTAWIFPPSNLDRRYDELHVLSIERAPQQDQWGAGTTDDPWAQSTKPELESVSLQWWLKGARPVRHSPWWAHRLKHTPLDSSWLPQQLQWVAQMTPPRCRHRCVPWSEGVSLHHCDMADGRHSPSCRERMQRWTSTSRPGAPSAVSFSGGHTGEETGPLNVSLAEESFHLPASTRRVCGLSDPSCCH